MTDEPKRGPVDRFFHACLLVVGGALALDIAIQLLAEIWVWLVIVGLIALAGFIGIEIWRHKRNRW
jgi:hypothetical protein